MLLKSYWGCRGLQGRFALCLAGAHAGEHFLCCVQPHRNMRGVCPVFGLRASLARTPASSPCVARTNMHGLCHDAAVFSRDGSAVFSRDGGRCSACGRSSSAPAHRKNQLARESGVTQEVFDQEKKQRDTDDKEDLLEKLYASHWAVPPEFYSAKTVPPEQITAVSLRCLKLNALGSQTCTMCNKVVDEWGSHFHQKDHQDAAAQMACFDEVLGLPMIENSPRNIDGSFLAPALPLTQVKFREFWGNTPECLIDACRELIGKRGILVRVASKRAQETFPLDKIKGLQLSVATYSGVRESKYSRHLVHAVVRRARDQRPPVHNDPGLAVGQRLLAGGRIGFRGRLHLG